ncbi:putative acyltransferase [Sebaldella termitidis]|jgi:ElaA protein|uniref:GCN5-related N-acetyltransferase n=1 Tax=Sebaldella termitidis (strain ATCC 33386 / NCTC 11300) TaxID=526218 RepID=D1AJI7_SEBTE|nr:GNAT family N-acetyltransferase [Sebaldella termitidis]ACZ08875.1 GCN5-related N-acetyltransferase [Sebaldella termitidis ATCC 33386]SUI24195.1 putative acyltransferase [Sebaldella termitidis]
MEKVIKKFDELTLNELYDILKLRVDIFVVEQNCPYGELDNKDKESIHIFYRENGEITAYLRIIPKFLSYESVSMGRICVKQEFRSRKLGREIVKDAINYIEKDLKEYIITIGAQEYLKDFYVSFDFKPVSDIYDEDGIKHLDMQRKCLGATE